MGGVVVWVELLCGWSCCVGEAVEHTLITYRYQASHGRYSPFRVSSPVRCHWNSRELRGCNTLLT